MADSDNGAYTYTPATFAKKDDPYVDAVLVCEGGEKLHVHRIVLASVSRFFHRLFLDMHGSMDAPRLDDVATEERHMQHKILSVRWSTATPSDDNAHSS